MKKRSVYHVTAVYGDRVLIVDKDGPVSVTNDAENVCLELAQRFPNRRIFYRDTMGNWDELLHDNGAFKGYAPARFLNQVEEQKRGGGFLRLRGRPKVGSRTPCPQCGSLYCGPIACRFTGKQHPGFPGRGEV